MAIFERAQSLSPNDINIMASLGRALQELGRFEQSLGSYDRALARDPDHVELLTNRGHALAGLGRMEEALASLDRALALRPGFPEGLSNRGNVLRALRPLRRGHRGLPAGARDPARQRGRPQQSRRDLQWAEPLR